MSSNFGLYPRYFVYYVAGLRVLWSWLLLFILVGNQPHYVQTESSGPCSVGSEFLSVQIGLCFLGLPCTYTTWGLVWGLARTQSLWYASLGLFQTHAVQTYYLRHRIQFSCSVVSDSLQPHGLQNARPPCPSPTPGVYPNSCPLSRWCYPTISSSVVPFSSCLQSFPASGSFQMSHLCAWGGQSIGFSVSTPVLPMNTQDWSPLGWTGWISLQSKGLSRVFCNTTVQKHQFFGA